MIRCDVCGDAISYGHTNDNGDFHVCEKCFEEYMDNEYGKNQWMWVDDDGEGGFVLASHRDTCETFGTGIYWTVFERGEET